MGKRIFDELSASDGYSAIALNSKLPCLKAFVYETLRHCMVTPLGLPHGCYGGEVEVNGYKIYPGTQVFINYMSILRKEKDAAEFNIDRWLDKDGNFNLKYQQESFLLFGYSTRDCIGKNIAKQVMFNDKMPNEIPTKFDLTRSIEPEIPICF